MNTLLKILVKIDKFINVLLGGSFSETLSSRAHRMAVKQHPYWGWTARAIDSIAFWEDDHCRKQWEREQASAS